MAIVLNLPPEVIAVGRLYIRELRRARMGGIVRPVGRPRKVRNEPATAVHKVTEQSASPYQPGICLYVDGFEIYEGVRQEATLPQCSQG